MAVETIVMDLTLRLVLNNGLDKNGKTVFKNKQFKRVKNKRKLRASTKRSTCSCFFTSITTSRCTTC